MIDEAADLILKLMIIVGIGYGIYFMADKWITEYNNQKAISEILNKN